MHAATLANLPDTIYFLVMRGFDLHAANEVSSINGWLVGYGEFSREHFYE